MQICAKGLQQLLIPNTRYLGDDGLNGCLGDSDCVKQVAEMRPFFRLSMSPMVNSLPKDLIYLVYHVTLG
ncbi:hypothetical protein FF066_18865 [Salmonella enterica]|nr:hypothetical protein [Salmonella enterica]EAW5544884.1 hypothetical protein [Salmonella enterica]EBB3678408.1 hypothetical protein [Salmonella enterica]EBB5206084.1 hypothetical protein [Salmonella enterica]EBB8026529.1 hypothetical protein [Salmonella enterica]